MYGGKPWIVSLIRNDNKSFLISFKENGYKKLQLLNGTSKINYFKNDEFTFAKLQDDENESLLVYSPYSKSLNKFSISKDGINYSLKQIIDGVDINNYFIDKFNRTNYHLVYSDKEKGCISVLQLKK